MPRYSLQGFVLLLVTQMSCAGWPQASSGEWTTYVYGEHAEVGRLDTSDVPESSGLIASRLNPGIYWTHNDSGNYRPRVWAFRLNKTDLEAGTPTAMGYVQLAGASLIDWEDISAGPGNTIYILDGGDNPACNRTNKRIYRFIEPVIDPDGLPVALSAPSTSIRFDYPDSQDHSTPADQASERYDCEAMMVHPMTGDIYLVTKRDTHSHAVARVYRLSAVNLHWNSPEIHVLAYVTDLTEKVAGGNFFGQVTAGDIDAAGRRIVLRNYAPAAYEFVLPDGQPFDAIFAQPPRKISLGSVLNERKGEAIAYAADGGDLITTSENNPMRVYRTPWALANIRVRKLRNDEATIRWQTAEAAPSQVDYGPTVLLGRQCGRPGMTTHHAVTLRGISAGLRYYYRVVSGNWKYPPVERASESFLTTLGGLAADFDEDGDVDMIDFTCLQNCLSGLDIDQDDPGCARALLDADDDVDGDDIAFFGGCMSGPGIRADSNCEQPPSAAQ